MPVTVFQAQDQPLGRIAIAHHRAGLGIRRTLAHAEPTFGPIKLGGFKRQATDPASWAVEKIDLRQARATQVPRIHHRRLTGKALRRQNKIQRNPARPHHGGYRFVPREPRKTIHGISHQAPIAPHAVCAILQSMTDQPTQDNETGFAIFERPLVAQRRMRARNDLSQHDFLHAHVAAEMSDRLMAVQRDFKLAAEFGARSGHFAQTPAGRAIPSLAGVDLVPPRARTQHTTFAIADEERSPFAEASLDLILATLCLHAVNDLPGTLSQWRRMLRPDGFFMGTLFGGETLRELRSALMEAELETAGGAAPRITPVVDVRDAGSLLQRAGFALPVTDTDVLTIRYDSMMHLLADLRGMGETNVLRDRYRGFLRRDTLMRAAAIYQDQFADPDGRVRATFEIVYLAGWAPDPSQQQPLKPGSAKARLADALGASEISSGEKPGTA
jgi:SAM-dependent methyltransferase